MFCFDVAMDQTCTAAASSVADDESIGIVQHGEVRIELSCCIY